MGDATISLIVLYSCTRRRPCVARPPSSHVYVHYTKSIVHHHNYQNVPGRPVKSLGPDHQIRLLGARLSHLLITQWT
ncbi:hypothetical protein BC827DRAFT_704077 [Russula dissimulans]|nr:hypothetical protein BC827DRAFT_704077 [Russula dissimulans]